MLFSKTGNLIIVIKITLDLPSAKFCTALQKPWPFTYRTLKLKPTK